MSKTYYIVGVERFDAADIARIINRNSQRQIGYDLMYETPSEAIEANKTGGCTYAAELPLFTVTIDKVGTTQ